MEFRVVLDLLKKMILRKAGSSGSSASGVGIGDGIIPLKSIGFVPHFIQRKKVGDIVSSGSGSFLSSLIWSSAGSSMDKADTTATGRMNGAGLMGGTSWNIAKNRQLYAFSSTIRRIRINHGTTLDEELVGNIPEQHHREVEEAAFVQYEITCQLIVQCTNSTTLGEGADRQISWSIWKRYSEFQSFDAKIRKIFGWHLNSVSFPPSHHLRWMWVGACGASGSCRHNRLWQKQNKNHRRVGLNTVDDSTSTIHQKFVHQRRKELKNYWEALGKCDMIFDFADPSIQCYSRDMANFLELEQYFPRSGGGKRAISAGGGGSSSMGDGLSCSSFQILQQGIRRRNFSNSSSMDMDTSTISHQSSQLSSRCERSTRGSLQLDRDHGGEIILTEKSIETSSMLPNPSSRSDGGQKQKRITAVAKPAFQRRLLDSL